jgi:hypothetical protein
MIDCEGHDPSAASRASAQRAWRSVRLMVTVSPAVLPMRVWRALLIGSLWVPSPSAMNDVWNSWSSMVPLTLTSPRVPKKAAVQSVMTQVHAPGSVPRWSSAVKGMVERADRAFSGGVGGHGWSSMT